MSRILGAAALAAVLATPACLDEVASSASKQRPAAAAKTVRTGTSYALAAQPDWRGLETAAGPARPNVQLAQAQLPAPGRGTVTTLMTNDPAPPAAQGPVAPARASTFTLNSPGRRPVTLSLTPNAVEPLPVIPAPDQLPAAEAVAAPAAKAPATMPMPKPKAMPAAAEAAPAAAPADAAPADAAPAKKQTLAQIAERAAWRVQIASLSSEEAAASTWSRVKTAHTDLLGPLDLNIERAELGERGIFYRVQTGSFSERKSAEDLCSSLKARNLSCLVVRSPI